MDDGRVCSHVGVRAQSARRSAITDPPGPRLQEGINTELSNQSGEMAGRRGPLYVWAEPELGPERRPWEP